MSQRMRFYLFCFILVVFSQFSQAQYFQMDLMKKRQSNKESTRWTLVDWLAQKRRINLWDQWLAANRSANIFELQLGGGKFDYELETKTPSVKTTVSESSQVYSVDIWLYFVGLRGEYEDQDSSVTTKSGLISLRLLGSSLQSTYLALNGGLQVREDDTSGTNEKWENMFASGSLNIYLLDFLGVHGEYRYFFPKKSNLETELSGSRLKGGGFLEYGVVRVVGNYWQENYELDSGNQTEDQERSGLELGLRLTF